MIVFTLWTCSILIRTCPGMAIDGLGQVPGLCPGDVICSWRIEGEGDIHENCGIVDWIQLLSEAVWRDSVTLTIKRLDKRIDLALTHDDLKKISVKPKWTSEIDAAFLVARVHARRAEISTAIVELETLADVFLQAQDWQSAVFIDLEMARLLTECGDVGQSLDCLYHARDLAGAHQSRSTELHVLELMGETLIALGDHDAADRVFQDMQHTAASWQPVSHLHVVAIEHRAALARKASKHQKELELCVRALKLREKLAPDGTTVIEGLKKCGAASDSLDDYETSKAFYSRALDIARNLSEEGDEEVVALLLKLSYASLGQMDLASSAQTLSEAIDIQESLNPDAPMMGSLLINMGNVVFSLEGPQKAKELFLRAAEIYDRVRPISFENATVLNNLGVVSGFLGDFDDEEAFFKRSLDVRIQLDPRHRDVPQSLVNLGSVAWRHGNLRQAQDYFERARRLLRELAPNSRELTFCLSSMGTLAQERGFFADAERLFNLALDRSIEFTPRTLDHAARLDDLGLLACLRQDLDRARDYLNQAIEIRQHEAPNSLDVAYSFQHLGQVAQASQDWDRAWDYYVRAKEIRVTHAPESRETAMSLCDQARIAHRRGDPVTALELSQQAMDLFQKLGPGSLHVADTLVSQAGAHLDLSEPGTAEALLDRALDIFSAWALGSRRIAEVHHLMARAHLAQHRPNMALTAWQRAIDALETQTERIGGTQVAKASFRAATKSIYQENIELLVDEGYGLRALTVFERMRARILLDLMARRDLASENDDQTNQKRRHLQNQYDATLNQLWHASPDTDREKMKKARARLRQIQEELAQLALDGEDKIGLRLTAESGSTAEALLKTVDVDTLFLAYSIGVTQTVVFAVGPRDHEFDVTVIPIGEADWRVRVQDFRTAIRAKNPAFDVMGKSLSRDLLSFVSPRLGSAARLLILPDGPLHFVPFAALPDPTNSKSHKAYMIERLPIAYAQSLTLLQQLRQRPMPRKIWRIAAFGDPEYRAGQQGNAVAAQVSLRSLLRGKFTLTPLPMTRIEVEEIRELFQDDCMVYLGESATEEMAIGLPRDTAIVHFACHAFVDESSPLDSALALTIPIRPAENEENGFLQAWEIFDDLRLNADLVTLSACGTGLGRSLGGEGLMGLTRAFFHAGAKSVVASLWRISDTSTAVLMREFYRHLKAGLDKDEALRRAQIALIRGDYPELSQTGSSDDFDLPFYWAAFVLNGDWR